MPTSEVHALVNKHRSYSDLKLESAILFFSVIHQIKKFSFLPQHLISKDKINNFFVNDTHIH